MGWGQVCGRLYGTLGFCGVVFGIAGWGGDARTWAEWAGMNPGEAGILIGAGGVMIITYLVWEIHGIINRRKGSAKHGKPPSPIAVSDHATYVAGNMILMDDRSTQEFKIAIAKLPQTPLGDGHYCAELPPGTNVVTMADGSIRLAIPKQIAATFTVPPSTASVALSKRPPNGS